MAVYLKCLLCYALICFSPVYTAMADEKAVETTPAPQSANNSAGAFKDQEDDLIDRILGTEDKTRFTPHALNYAVINDNDAVVQFSLKYRMIRDFGLFFAYTNKILWDVWEYSTPYRDINFMPELFYRYQPELEWLYSTDIGYWHNSNGKDGDKDRAWDRLFWRLNTRWEIAGLNLVWLSHIFFYTLNTNDDNSDIDDYLGWWDTALFIRDILPRAKNRDNIDIEFQLTSGEKGNPFNRGNQTIGLRYKFKKAAFQPHLYIQYFHGYGEVILDYARETEQLRFGLAFYY